MHTCASSQSVCASYKLTVQTMWVTTALCLMAFLNTAPYRREARWVRARDLVNMLQRAQRGYRGTSATLQLIGQVVCIMPKKARRVDFVT